MFKLSIITLVALSQIYAVTAITISGLGYSLTTCPPNAYCGSSICVAHKQPTPLTLLSHFVIIPQCCKEGFYGTGLFPSCKGCDPNQYAPYSGLATCLPSFTYQSKTIDPGTGEVATCNDGFKKA